METLNKEHAEEEQQNKANEQEARMAQKRLEEEKARLRYEQQRQIEKQEKNTAELKPYFEAMNLSFHHGEEDFNASMSVLSHYHQDIMDNFRFYSLLQDQKFSREENTMITLEGFIHFLKIMNFAGSRSEVESICDHIHEIDGFEGHIKDPLNIFNGLNYAQFLEAILRTAYYKKQNNPDRAEAADGYKVTLEGMFDESLIDIKKRMKNQVLKHVNELANTRFFEENFHLLAGVYTASASIKD